MSAYIVVNQARLDRLDKSGAPLQFFVRAFADRDSAHAKAAYLSGLAGGDAYRVIDIETGALFGTPP